MNEWWWQEWMNYLCALTGLGTKSAFDCVRLKYHEAKSFSPPQPHVYRTKNGILPKQLRSTCRPPNALFAGATPFVKRGDSVRTVSQGHTSRLTWCYYCKVQTQPNVWNEYIKHFNGGLVFWSKLKLKLKLGVINIMDKTDKSVNHFCKNVTGKKTESEGPEKSFNAF